MKQDRIMSGEHHGITRYDVVLALFYPSFLWRPQFSRACGTSTTDECRNSLWFT